MARPKGSLNKPKRMLIARLEELFPGYHPIVDMAAIANDTAASKEDRFAANKEVAQYYQPKLKAMDINANVDSTLTVVRKEYKPKKGNS